MNSRHQSEINERFLRQTSLRWSSIIKCNYKEVIANPVIRSRTHYFQSCRTRVRDSMKKATEYVGKKSEGLADRTQHHVREIWGICPHLCGSSIDQSTQFVYLSLLETYYCNISQNTTASSNVDCVRKLCFYFRYFFFLNGSTALVGPRRFSVSWSIFLQSAGLLEWVISSSQGLYRNFWTGNGR
jgi:hypothetical protein